ASEFPERGIGERTITEGRGGAGEASERLSHPEGLVGFRSPVAEELLRVLENARVPKQEVKAALVEVEEPLDQLSLGAVSLSFLFLGAPEHLCDDPADADDN